MEGIGPQLATIVVLVVISGLCSGTEIALVSLRPAQVDRFAEAGRRERTLAELVQDPNRFLATLQIGTTLAGFLASAIGAVTLAAPLVEILPPLGGLAQPLSILVVTAVLTYVTLVLGELAPKRVAMRHAEGWSLRAAIPLDLASRLLRPVIWILSTSIDLVVRLVGVDPRQAREELGEVELHELLSMPGIVPDVHQEVLLGAMAAGSRRLREVMIPRLDVVAVHEDTPASDALETLLARSYSRAPVYREDLDDADRTVSVVALARSSGRVADHAVEATVLPESLPVLDAIRDLQRDKRQLAIVLSEHGGVEGIVSTEDLLEEIVGELHDEHDRDRLEVRHTPDGGLVLPGRFPVTDLDDVEVAFDPDAVDATSLGGLFSETLGRIPRGGERITVQGHGLEARQVRRRAVTEVVLWPDTGRDGGSPDGSP